MPLHEIAKLWHSKVKFGNVEQPDDDFDLKLLNDTGTNVTDCKHGNLPIHSGSVDEVTDAPNPRENCYLVRLNHRPTLFTQVQYRGVAIRGSDGQFHTIVGIRKTVFLGLPPNPKAPDKEIDAVMKELRALVAGQDEGTWTGTQP